VGHRDDRLKIGQALVPSTVLEENRNFGETVGIVVNNVRKGTFI
jgi:hypothetical protein